MTERTITVDDDLTIELMEDGDLNLTNVSGSAYVSIKLTPEIAIQAAKALLELSGEAALEGLKAIDPVAVTA